MVESLDVARSLLSLSELEGVGDIALLDLTSDAYFETLARNALLQADKHLERRLYLVAGQLELIANGKVIQNVSADTPRALLPVFRVHTHGLHARCIKPARLLSINEQTFERYVATIRPKQSDGITVEELADAEEEASIIGEIRHVFTHREVDLPSLPDIAIKIHAAIQDADKSVRDIAMLVQTDPMIAARTVQVANSAMYGDSKNNSTVQDAIQRIGMNALRVIVLSVTLRNLFQPASEYIHKRTRTFYKHSIRVGAISYILARHLQGFNPDHAFLAGLIHDIGVVPILIMADKRDDLSANPARLERLILDLGKTAGGMLLEQWGFDPELVTVARYSEHWQRETDKADYCDIVQVAQLHCYLVDGKKLDSPMLNILPAFKRLHLEKIDPMEIINESRHEIVEIISLLSD